MRKGLAIITGADGGMGTEITRAVALAGYSVVMACYNAEKAEVKRKLLIETLKFLVSFLSISEYRKTAAS